jgi:hypothetical protein
LDGGEWGGDEDPIEIDMPDDLIGDGAGADNAGGAGDGAADVGGADSDIFIPPSQGADPL